MKDKYWGQTKIFGILVWVSTNQGQSLIQACQIFGEFKVKSQTLTHKFLFKLEHQVYVNCSLFMAEKFGTPIGGGKPVVWAAKGKEKKFGIQARKTIPKP